MAISAACRSPTIVIGGALVGEVIRRTKNGKFLGYYLRFYEGGRRRILASKQPTLAEARRMLLEIEARVARGERGIPERGEWCTVTELADRFLCEYSRPRLKDIESYRAHTRCAIKKPLQIIGTLRVDQVTPADMARMRDLMCKGSSPGTVKNCILRLSVVFSWGVKHRLAPTNPCRGVEKPKVEDSFDFLTREEVQRLLAAAKSSTSTPLKRMRFVAIALAIHTGLRKGELLGLRWIDLDLDQLRLTVARSFQTTPKGGKTRHLRLPSVLVPILREWRRECPQTPCGLVLPAGRTTIKPAGENTMLALPQLFAEIGLRPVLHPWHLLRHTFASHFVMRGGNILALQKILGHSDLKMTMVYAHLAPDFLGQEMERVSFED
jgi:integrase